jgi:hypothetical protein
VEPNVDAIAQGIEKLYEKGASNYIPNIIEEKKKYSWETMASNFLILYQQI